MPHFNQSEALPKYLGTDASSVWNFCARFSDVISRGNQWWRLEMSAVFSAQNFIRKLLVLISEVQGWSCPASWWETVNMYLQFFVHLGAREWIVKLTTLCAISNLSCISLLPERWSENLYFDLQRGRVRSDYQQRLHQIKADESTPEYQGTKTKRHIGYKHVVVVD